MLKWTLARDIVKESDQNYIWDECEHLYPRSGWSHRSLDNNMRNEIMYSCRKLTACWESSMHWMEWYIVDSINHALILRIGHCVLSVTFEGEIASTYRSSASFFGKGEAKSLPVVLIFYVSLNPSQRLKGAWRRTKTYWIATRPSILPTANPEFWDAVKQDTTRVCHFRGDTMVYLMSIKMSRFKRRHNTLYGVAGLVRLKTWIWRSAVPTTKRGYCTSKL